MRHFKWSSSLAVIAVGLSAGLVCVQTGVAQTTTAAAVGNPNPGTEEIIVTATKRATVLKDVPISVTAFTATKIEDYQIARPADFISLTPNVSLLTVVRPGEADVS